jgi:hypothetical protein
MRALRRFCATFWLMAAVLAGACGPAAAQVSTPPQGSPLRTQILDALRPRIEADIGGRIVFVVSVIHVANDWAFVQAKPQRSGGAPIDWRATRFRQDFEQDLMSDLVLGLLRRTGGRWTLVTGVVGPTDVVWENWVKQYQLPRELFLPP